MSQTAGKKNRKPPKNELFDELIGGFSSTKIEGKSEDILHDRWVPNNPENQATVGHSTTDFAINRIDKLVKLKEDLGHENMYLKYIHEEVLYEILAECTQLSIVARDGILGDADAHRSKKEKQLSEVLPIVVTEPENTIMRLTIPPLIGRRFKGTYDIYMTTRLAIKEHLKNRPKTDYFGHRLFLIYKKYAPNLSTDYTCDNDNWEAGRVTNAISEAIDYADNAEHFSFIYTSVESQYKQMEATLIYQKDLHYFLEYMDNNTPDNPLVFDNGRYTFLKKNQGE